MGAIDKEKEKIIHRLKVIHAFVDDILGKEYDIEYYQDEEDQDIPYLEIRKSGVLEEVMIFYTEKGAFINLWVCKDQFPGYSLWIAKYLLALVTLKAAGVKINVVFDDCDSDYPESLKDGMRQLIQILKEKLDG